MNQLPRPLRCALLVLAAATLPSCSGNSVGPVAAPEVNPSPPARAPAEEAIPGVSVTPAVSSAPPSTEVVAAPVAETADELAAAGDPPAGDPPAEDPPAEDPPAAELVSAEDPRAEGPPAETPAPEVSSTSPPPASAAKPGPQSPAGAAKTPTVAEPVAPPPAKPPEKSPEPEKPSFDHSAWTRILAATVSAEGWVDYARLRRQHGAALAGYRGQLATADLDKLDPKERKAFWLNAYNALCIQKLLDHKLPKEVPHSAFFGTNVFKERTYVVAGKKRSLDDIEHGIVRKLGDNRVHAALVCGASSCPRLRPEAYTGATLDRALDEECRRWIREGRDLRGRRKNYLDPAKKLYHASKIFDWFQEDFADSERGVLSFVKRFASAEERAFLEANRVRVRYLDYDWTLNQKR